MLKLGSPARHREDKEDWRIRHEAVLPLPVQPTIMVEWREFLVSYNWMTLVSVNGVGCRPMSRISCSMVSRSWEKGKYRNRKWKKRVRHIEGFQKLPRSGRIILKWFKKKMAPGPFAPWKLFFLWEVGQLQSWEIGLWSQPAWIPRFQPCEPAWVNFFETQFPNLLTGSHDSTSPSGLLYSIR